MWRVNEMMMNENERRRAKICLSLKTHSKIAPNLQSLEDTNEYSVRYKKL